jgi:hypothetical protein
MFKINISKLKENHLNNIKFIRKLQLEKLDIEYIKALEINDTTNIERIINLKKKLRDIPSDPIFLNASNVDEVINYHPDFLENLNTLL